MKRISSITLVLIIALMLVGAGGYAYGASLERNDAFCASCHTEPESTYYQRSLAADPVDLAAFHAAKETNCIDCHSGKGVPGRAKAMLTGAMDMLAYKTGNYQQPARTTRPVNNASCTKCHNMPLVPPGGEAGEGRSLDGIPGHDGHYHADSLQLAWRVRGGPVNRCAVCHPAHQPGNATNRYMDSARIDRGCDMCHAAIGEGGREGGD